MNIIIMPRLFALIIVRECLLIECAVFGAPRSLRAARVQERRACHRFQVQSRYRDPDRGGGVRRPCLRGRARSRASSGADSGNL